jgi:hypothetical protein
MRQGGIAGFKSGLHCPRFYYTRLFAPGKDPKRAGKRCFQGDVPQVALGEKAVENKGKNPKEDQADSKAAETEMQDKSCRWQSKERGHGK